jgi:hypothetical protein
MPVSIYFVPPNDPRICTVISFEKRLITVKDAVQSVCKQRLCLHFGIQNIEFYSTTIYIFMILEYNKLSRDNNQALQEHKMK